jgi:hypothetical protein
MKGHVHGTMGDQEVGMGRKERKAASFTLQCTPSEGVVL